MNKRHDINWPVVWHQVSEAMAKSNAPSEAIDAIYQTEWKTVGDKFLLFCPRVLYEWIEVPASAETESNLKLIKPILWPVMQRLGCRTLIYKLI